MNPGEFATSQSLIVFGLAVVIFVYLMRRTYLRVGSSADRQRAKPADEESASAQMSIEAVAETLEVRLFDFAREVEGRLQTRTTILDRLIVEADREILRLQDLLAATKGIEASAPTEPRSLETATAGRTPTRQPDVMLPQPAPTNDNHREAA